MDACIICGKDHDRSLAETVNTEYPKGYNSLWGFELATVCSFECYEHWKKARALITVVEFIKKLPALHFHDIQEVLQLGEEGGYAEKKIGRAMHDPMGFLYSLSTDNVIKLAKLVSKQNL